MQTTIGCTSRPYNKLGYAEAYARIAAAGYTDVAVFANDGQIPVRSDSSAAEVAAVRAAAAAEGGGGRRPPKFFSCKTRRIEKCRVIPPPFQAGLEAKGGGG